MVKMIDLLSKGERFYTFNERFFYNQESQIAIKQRLKYRTAIILQGPISSEGNFTLKLIKFYLNNYDNLQVILSTWNDQDTSRFSELKEFGNFHLLKSEYPAYKGISNINLQIVSAQAGLQLAKSLSVERAIKSRTDQGFLNQFALVEIEHYFQRFRNQDKPTILALDRNTFLFRLYGVSDMFQYSDLESLIAFWSIKLDSRVLEEVLSPKPGNILEYASRNTGETYLVTSYLNSLGESTEFTFERHSQLLRGYFLILDSFPLGYIWNKYQKDERPWNKPDTFLEFREVKFIDWLNLNENLYQNSLVFDSLLINSNDL